jgi:cold shock CspA family protein
MATEQQAIPSTETTSDRLIGQVKWFNNKAGYGFITVKDGENAGKDIFAHFSTIFIPNNTQYRYLVQGEYVEFVLSRSNTSEHEFQATHISGIRGGLLMCQTRQNNRPVYNRTPATNEGDDESDTNSAKCRAFMRSERRKYSRTGRTSKISLKKTTQTRPVAAKTST